MQNSAGLEGKFIRCWVEILGDDSPSSDFFEAGGNSLAAVRLTAALREDLGVEVPVRLIFEYSDKYALMSLVLNMVRAVREMEYTGE